MVETSGSSKGFYVIIVVGMLVCGTLNTISFKEQDDFVVDESNPRPFYHPFVQTYMMFIAEFACLAAFYIAQAASPTFRKNHELELQDAIQQNLKTTGVWWKAALPALCDIGGTGLQLVAMNFMSQSVFVMLRGGSPVIIAILTVIFLKRILARSQIFGLSLVVFGVTIVGVNTFITTNSNDSPNLVAGVICCFLSMFGSGIQAIVEEKILRKNHIHPLKLVGFEGMFGLIYNTVLIAIANQIPCDVNNVQACNANGKVEDIASAVRGIFSHSGLLSWVIIAMVSLGLTNFFAMSVTKIASALTRAVLTITTLVLIWVYNLTVNHDKFYPLQLVGFIILIIGNLIYQKVLRIPGLDKRDSVKGSVLGSKACRSFGRASVDPVPRLLIEEDEEIIDNNTTIDLQFNLASMTLNLIFFIFVIILFS